MNAVGIYNSIFSTYYWVDKKVMRKVLITFCNVAASFFNF